MSDATATIVETPAKTGELRVESLHNSAEAAIESGDVSGVYRIAQNQVDETVTRELGISKIDDAQTAAVAGPEIIALKQADADFENKTKTALGGLKTSIDSVGKPAETVVPMASDFESARIAQEDAEAKRIYPDPQSDPAVQKVGRYVSGKVDRRVAGWINFEKTSNKKNPSADEIAQQKQKEVEAATDEAWADFQRSYPEKVGAYKDLIPELGISKIDDAQTATLGGLKTSIGSFNAPTTLPTREEPVKVEETAIAEEARLAAVAEKAMKEGPLTTEEMAADLEKHEAEEARKEMAKITPEEAAAAIPLIIKREDPVITVEELKPEEQKEVQEVAALAELDEDIERGVQTFEKELAKIDAELAAEKKAFEDFNASHGMAHTKLEQAYLEALANRIAALEFEKKSHETGDVSLEVKAKAAELKQLADKAESSYQEMYNAFLHQPETVPKESKPEKIGLHLDEEDENYEAQQYEQYHPGNTFGQIKSSGSARMTSGSGTFEGVSAPQTQKPKGRFGKFIDGLKFWKYFTSKST
jgi:hypothetical protein